MAQPISNVPKKAFSSAAEPQDDKTRQLWLNELVDVLSRPSSNRVTASTSAVAVNLNGAIQSTGIGTNPITPGKYAETQVQARATFSLSAVGSMTIYVYRTTGAIPAAGAAPNAGDVIVGGDGFAGGTMQAGVNQAGALGFTDGGLNQNQAYRYYFAVSGTGGLVGRLVNNSQIIVSEF